MQFNLSASSINLYNKSQIQFYYTHIVKAEEDSTKIESYGCAGSIVHKILENYIEHKDKSRAEEEFIKMWDEKGVSTMITVRNGVFLNMQEYFDCVKEGIRIIDKTNIKQTEMEITIPLKEGFNKKGYIDLVIEENGKIVLVDWKTSNSKDVGGDFRLQALMYAHLYWCKTGVFVNTVRFQYLKLGVPSEEYFTNEEIIGFGDDINRLLEEIINKGNHASNYELGDWNNIFNPHKNKCRAEERRRLEKNIIRVYRVGSKLYFLDGIPDQKLLKYMRDIYFSYKVENYFQTDKFKKGIWDGSKKMMKKGVGKNDYGLYYVPYPYIHKVTEIIQYYNEKFGTNYEVKVEEPYINTVVTEAKFNTQYRESDIKLRPYQEEAINVMLEKKVMVLNLPTASGKTLLSAELIKKINKRTIFVVNRVELARQTKEEFEDYLGVEVGFMTEGEIQVDKQITVCSIQTISAILKREDETSKLLKAFLYNINVMVYDECHGCKSTSQYGELSELLVNCEYMYGLSGSPWRNYKEETLEMNSLVGFIGYTKTAKELEELGYLCPTKVLFYDVSHKDFETSKIPFSEIYKEGIVYNEGRNDLILKLVEQHKGKKLLLVTRSVKHGEYLHENIKGSYYINGSTNKEDRKKWYEEFKNSKEGGVLVGSIQIFAVGINVPDLDVIINASATRSSILAVQTIGRVKRKTEGKIEGLYIDFLDDGYFKKFTKKRIQALKDNGENVERAK